MPLVGRTGRKVHADQDHHGAERPDAGTLRVAGRDVPHMDPATSHALGIAAIYQQPALFPHLTVAENVALALEGGALAEGGLARRHQAAAALLARVGSAIDPARTVDTLSMPEQQIVEIAKAIGAAHRRHGRAHGLAHDPKSTGSSR